MAQHQYQSLRAGEIRLLKLSSTRPLKYKLIHVRVHSKPRYVALSYTWGQELSPERLCIRNGYMSITQNLADALDQLRVDHKKDLLWIDAICINQADDNEKSVQIRLMTSIYEGAYHVYVWLGKPKNIVNARLAMKMLAHFYEGYLRLVKHTAPIRPWWWPKRHHSDKSYNDLMGSLIQKWLSKHKYLALDPSTEMYQSWLGICELWNSPWWTRTWVYQEATIPESDKMLVTGWFMPINVIVQPPKITFHSGDCRTSWIQLDVAAIFTLPLSGPGIEIIHKSMKNYWRLKQFRGSRFGGPPASLLELLARFRYSACGDPRDKIFAPLCLASKEAMDFVNPDYGKQSLRDVCTTVVRFCLRDQDDPLGFLGHIMKEPDGESQSTSQSSETWPSWLPSWNKALEIEPLGKDLYIPAKEKRYFLLTSTDKPAQFEGRGVKVYNATGDSKANARISGGKLSIRGFKCDEVSNSLPNPIPDTLQQAQEIASELPDVYIIPGETLATSLFRTQVADIRHDASGIVRGRYNGTDWPEIMVERSKPSDVDWHARIGVTVSLNKANQQRKLCRTSNRTMALVPCTAQTGDEIYAFLGSQVLYVLRRRGNRGRRYEFIGECYVHGMMDGEAMSKSSVIQDICLV